MAFCETCGKEFKTEQGLAGHQQLKYARERSPAVEHAHESSCSGCQQMAQETYTRGRIEAIEEVTEIPGVLESIAFAKDSERWNQEHPDHPTIENWALVEQVKELVEGSRPNLINIVKTEEPLIRVIKSEEPAPDDRLIGQQVAEIIRQNYG